MDEYGCRGIVELAFMSCSTQKAVAVQYATRGNDKNLPVVLEIALGQVDLGA